MYHIIVEDSNILDYVLYEALKEHIEDEMLGSRMIRCECSTDRGTQVWYELETDSIEDVRVVVKNCSNPEKVLDFIKNYKWFIDVDCEDDFQTVNVYPELFDVEKKDNDLIIFIEFNIC